MLRAWKMLPTSVRYLTGIHQYIYMNERERFEEAERANCHRRGPRAHAAYAEPSLVNNKKVIHFTLLIIVLYCEVYRNHLRPPRFSILLAGLYLVFKLVVIQYLIILYS